jgi:hypothetical protein
MRNTSAEQPASSSPDGAGVSAVEAGPDQSVRADTAHTDALPADLDATAYVGPYVFPDIKRRRVLGAIYIGTGAALLGAWLAARGPDAVGVNRGIAVGGAALVLIGLYHLLAGWPLKTDQTEALAAASRRVGFPVGHASAQLGWRGLLSRPTWRILLYSADEPPTTRGLVLVDGVNAEIVGDLVQDNPEDWSVFDR